MGTLKKLKKVKVMTPKGERYLTFAPVDSVPVDDIVCTTKCPYGKICDKLIDPRNPDKFDEYVFTDFCSELGLLNLDNSGGSTGENNEENLLCMVPVKGTIEEAFSKDYPDIFTQIIDKNPLVNVKDFIDSVCSGWCGSYNSEYSNCKSSNKLCMLNGLFMKQEKDEISKNTDSEK